MTPNSPFNLENHGLAQANTERLSTSAEGKPSLFVCAFESVEHQTLRVCSGSSPGSTYRSRSEIPVTSTLSVATAPVRCRGASDRQAWSRRSSRPSVNGLTPGYGERQQRCLTRMDADGTAHPYRWKRNPDPGVQWQYP